MWNIVFQIFLALRAKTKTGIELFQIFLGTYFNVLMRPMLCDKAQSLLHQLPSLTGSAHRFCRKHSAYTYFGIGQPGRQNPAVGGNGTVLPVKKMICLKVPIVQILIGTVLLYNKYGITHLQNAI